MIQPERRFYIVRESGDAPPLPLDTPEEETVADDQLAVRDRPPVPAPSGEVVEPTRIWAPGRTVDLVVRRVETFRAERGGVVRIAAKATRSGTTYGVIGLSRAAGSWWRWVMAAELDQQIATRPEMVLDERKRRRTITLWTAGGGAVADVMASTTMHLPMWAIPAGLLGAIAAVGGVAEWVVRRSTVQADAGEGAPVRDIGAHPSGKAVRKIFVDAKLAKRIEDVKVIAPGVVRDGLAWTCEVELPSDVVYAEVVKKREKLAGASGRGIARMYVDPVPDHEGRCRLWSPDRDPLTGPPIKSPLIGRDKPFDIWNERVYMGRSPRGQDISFSPVGKALLTGGEPGSGKSVAVDQVLCAIALDPYALMVLADAKRVELAVYRKIAEQYLSKPDPEEYLALVEGLVAEMDRRYEVMEEAGVVKITGKNWKRLGCPFLAFHTDEVQFFTTSKLGGKDGDITKGLADLVGRGRAAGIFTSIATQRPAAEVVPTRLRDIMTTKLAMMCFTNAASDTILGQGMASKGYSGAHFDKDQKGAGWLHAEGSAPVQIRTGYLHKPDEGEGGDDDVRDIVEVAYRLRQATGTLPYSESNPDVVLVTTLLSIVGEADGMWTQDLLPRLNHVPEFADMTANDLAKRLRAILGEPDFGPKGLWLEDEHGKPRSRNGYERTDLVRAHKRLKGGRA